MSSRKIVVTAFLAVNFATVGFASAAGIAYMSGNGVEPWGMTSNIDAMNAAFGSGDWSRINFGDNFSSYNALYVDGGDGTSGAYANWLGANASALQTYVMNGGDLFLNAATWNNGQQTNLIFGSYQTLYNYSPNGYAVVPSNPIFGNGAGTHWTGNYFSHDVITAGANFTTLINGDYGPVLDVAQFGSGLLMIGTQTSTGWQQGVNGSNPFQLRVNELQYFASGTTFGPVPPPPAATPIPAAAFFVAPALASVFGFARRKSNS